MCFLAAIYLSNIIIVLLEYTIRSSTMPLRHGPRRANAKAATKPASIVIKKEPNVSAPEPEIQLNLSGFKGILVRHLEQRVVTLVVAEKHESFKKCV